MKKQAKRNIHNLYSNLLISLPMLAVALGFASCTDEMPELPVDQATPTMTVEATTTGSATRTALAANGNGYDVVWSEGDQIRIGGQMFTLVSGEGTTAGTFDGPQLADGTYDAYYATSNSPIPTSQTFTAGRISHSPMSGTLTVTDGTPGKLRFTNMGGLLRLTIKNNQKAKVKSISVSGTQSITATRVFLDCGSDGVVLAEAGTEFTIAMTAGSYSDVEIEITDTYSKTCTKKLGGGMKLDIQRSQITDASFSVLFDGNYSTYYMGHEYVDLGLPSGLKWATCNVGSDDWEKAGYYFAWGEIKPKDSYTYDTYVGTYQGIETLPLEFDAANVYWGGNWRMPTAAEVQELLDNCDWDQRNAFLTKVTSKTKKTESICFPTQGFKGEYGLQNSESGYYWCSTIEGPYPKTLQIMQGIPYTFTCGYALYYNGLQIRPVFSDKPASQE